MHEIKLKLPKNEKEGVIFGSVICVITVIIMLLLNVITSAGISKDAIINILKLLPIMWGIAMVVQSVFVGKIASFLANKFTSETDSYNAKNLFNMLFCVCGMSLLMSVIGNVVGTGDIVSAVTSLPTHWPRNFCVAFWCKILLAQPVARLVMKKIHLYNMKTENENLLFLEEKIES